MKPAAVAIRNASPLELDELTALCLRSKALWGYDTDFMAACRAELALCLDELDTSDIAVAEIRGRPAGIVQVTAVAPATSELSKLFVDPDHILKGIGSSLMMWAIQAARATGAAQMTIDSDPGAVGFYRRCGAVDAGKVASGSIPGRHLPRLILDLT